MSIDRKIRKNLTYHYTSVDTFKKILEGVEDKHLIMRASSIFAMNDPLEMYFGYSKIVDCLPIIEEELSVNPQYKLSLLWNNDTEFMRGEWKDAHLLKMKETSRHPFVVSSSRCRDSLPLWSMYGDGGSGVSLGFNTRIYFLKRKRKDGIWELDTSKIDVSEIKSIDVSYNNIHKFSVPFLLAKYEYVQYLKSVQGMIDKKDIIPLQIDALTRIMFYASPFIKHKSYKYERESRFLVEKEPMKEIKKDKKNRPYIEMKLKISDLKEVIIGPCCDFEKVKEKLEVQMLRVGIGGVDIVQSKIPYRR